MEGKYIFFRGWINKLTIDDQGRKWLKFWRTAAANAEYNNEELIVFQVPKSEGRIINELISDFEKYLKEKYGVPKEAKDNVFEKY